MPFPCLQNGVCGDRPDAGDVDEVAQRCGVGIDGFPAPSKKRFGVIIRECVPFVQQGQQFCPGKTVLPNEIVHLVPAA